MSGHNRWSKIKHKKGSADVAKGRIYSKVIKEITLAARIGGGDVDGNPQLRRALDLARASNMPQDNITRAIKKGTGELAGIIYEDIMYEGVGPSGTLFLVQSMTDNKNRTVAEIRKVFDVNNGQLGSSGQAAWAFEEKGVITLPGANASEEQLFELAVGAGAEDVELSDDEWTVTAPKASLEPVRIAIEAAKIAITSADVVFLPKTPKVVGAKEGGKLVKLFEALEEHDDVQKVFADFELSEEALAALANE